MRNYVRSFMNGESARQFGVMAVVGVVNTVVDFGLFNLFRGGFSWGLYFSLSLAFVLASFMSYLLNRRFTFGMRASGARADEGAGFILVNVIALGLTNGIMWLAELTFGPLTPLGENVAKVVAALIILAPKFAALRDVVFKRALAEKAEDQA